MNKKNKELVELYKKTIDLISERERIKKDINALDNEINNITNNFNNKCDEIHRKNSILLNNKESFCGYFSVIFSIIFTIKHWKINTYFTLFKILWVVFIFIGFMLIGYFIAFIIYKIFKKQINNILGKTKQIKENEESLISDKEVVASKIKEIEKEIEKLKKEQDNVQKKLDNINLGNLHSSYQNYNALSSFVNYLEKGRCDNLKECINLYEQDFKEYERDNEISKLQNQMSNINNQVKNINNQLEDVKSDVSTSLDLAHAEAEMRTGRVSYEDGKAKLEKALDNKK